MRNLKIVTHFLHKLSDKTYSDSHLFTDPLSNSIFIVNSIGLHQIQKDGEHFKEVNEIYWETHDLQICKVVASNYIPSLDCVCLITDTDIMTFNIIEKSIEVVGNVSQGIIAASWSPDQEMLILVTSDLSVIIMTAHFDPIEEFPLVQESTGENQFVNVGWGKKETQFHGSDGKQTAKEAKTTITKAFHWDDRLPRISWRGDGQLFAISFISSMESRVFRVINREGTILNNSEDVEGLEAPFQWKPSGNLITTSRRLSNKHNVAFFEKNGLLHNEFALPFETSEVLIQKLMWNEDSSTLLIWAKPFHKENSILQLYTMNNYHWYLKQHLVFEDIIETCWDAEIPLKLFVLTPSYLHIYRFLECVDVSEGKSNVDMTLISVVDGKRLLVTPLRQTVVPPPLSAYEVEFPDEINCVFYGPPLHETSESLKTLPRSNVCSTSQLPVVDSNTICIFHGGNTLTFLSPISATGDLFGKSCLTKLNCCPKNAIVHRVSSQNKLEFKIDLPFEVFPVGRLYNWTWISRDKIIACWSHSSTSKLIIFDLEGIGSEYGNVIATEAISLDEHVKTVTLATDGSAVCLQYTSGNLRRYDPFITNTIVPWISKNKEINFPSPCDEVILCTIDDISTPIGRTMHNRLFMGDVQILSNVTSFHLHNDHLLLTTTSHMLFIIPLNLDAFQSLSNNAYELSGVGTRSLERGSRIVTAVSSDTNVLLQMPRGNIEMISPRPLVIYKLKILLQDRQYYKAVDIMRKQRIDMNLLYDHDPAAFLENINTFVSKVGHPSWIDLFIASLSENDVSATTYSCNYAKISHDVKGVSSEDSAKIEKICNSIRDAMISIDEEKFLLPILTSYIKCSNSGMHTALMRLHDMKKSGKEYEVSFQEGLRHLLFVSDSNELCKNALGTYDFDLIMMVFEQSQKDPKEYLPFLNDLKKMNECYRKFKIDVHLKRYESAIQNLTTCDETYMEEGLDLIRSEKLYSKALESFKSRPEIYKKICKSYGDYLLSKGLCAEAAIMFSRSFDLKEALNAYTLADDWRGVLYISSQLNLTREEIRNLCFIFVEKLKDRGSYRDASILYEEYLNDEEEAIACHLKAFNWNEAIRLAVKYQRPDIIRSNIKCAILDHHKFIHNTISEKKSFMKNQCERLLLVRTLKEKELNELKEAEEYNLDEGLYSDASTVTGISHPYSFRTMTSASGKTYRSMKNKRKLERKKYSTKEGSTFEDLGLMVSLHNIFTEVDGLVETIHELNHFLMFFSEDLKAKNVQNLFDVLLTEMNLLRHKIWPKCKEEEVTEFGPQMTTDVALQQLKTSSDLGNSFLSQRLKELEPCYRFPPVFKNSANWKLLSLK